MLFLYSVCRGKEHRDRAPPSVSNIAVTGADSVLFTVNPATLALAVGDSAYVRVIVTPNSLGDTAGSLVLTHNAESSPTSIALSGTGVFPGIVVSTLPAFGDVLVGGSATDSVKVNNTGTALLSVSGIAVTGTALMQGGLPQPPHP